MTNRPPPKFGPWQIWTRYDDEEQWEIELVPEEVRENSSVTFTTWMQIMLWFRLLEKDIRGAAVQIRIEPLPADGVKLRASVSAQDTPAPTEKTLLHT